MGAALVAVNFLIAIFKKMRRQIESVESHILFSPTDRKWYYFNMKSVLKNSWGGRPFLRKQVCFACAAHPRSEAGSVRTSWSAFRDHKIYSEKKEVLTPELFQTEFSSGRIGDLYFNLNLLKLN